VRRARDQREARIRQLIGKVAPGTGKCERVAIARNHERRLRDAGDLKAQVGVAQHGKRGGERRRGRRFAREEPMVEIGLDGIVAARPVQPPLDAMRAWLAMLDKGLTREEREAIYRVLREAVPDFTGAAA